MNATRPFTHEITSNQPYYKNGPQQSTPPDGEWPQGTKVILLHEGGSYSQVQAEDDVTAYVLSGALKPLN